ncbi:MAG TPA: hypothetical protein VGJ05_10090 [Fimbriiglobus sp.]|jgi:hypothetical protein
MAPFVVILILIVAPMILGALLKMFKAYQEEVDRQNRRKKPRTAVPTVQVSSSTATTGGRGSGEIDRFLQEIDKLRQKAGSPVKVGPVKAVPVAKVVSKAKPRVEPPAFVTTAPVAPTRGGPIVELPVARAVAAAQSRPTPASGSTTPKVTVRGNSVPITPFGKDLAALLTSKPSIPLAVVLQEVLGPPKCRR